MSYYFKKVALRGLWICAAAIIVALCGASAKAAPYAALVMDARSGEVLYSRNADTRLHPASLTKMMTLYVAFQAIERGEISLDTKVKVTSQAANEVPSKLGLRTGQKIRLRYLMRAAAVKSANDAATAIGIAISGSEAAFAQRMNRTAAAMGMKNTTFRNAHGLTKNGHLSTARDMSILGRHVIYDYPQYYNLFSRRTADAGIATVRHTNIRFLDNYEGADGIKTGYTSKAGYNLTASARRGEKRVIATVFGGRSTADRTRKIVDLMDKGFSRSSYGTQVRKPRLQKPSLSNGQAKRQPLMSSVRPKMRPLVSVVDVAKLDHVIDHDVIAGALSEALSTPVSDALNKNVSTGSENQNALVQDMKAPKPRPAAKLLASVQERAPDTSKTDSEQEVVTRVSTSGGRHWGINVGRYSTRHGAERVLLKVALNENTTLGGSLRRIMKRAGGYDANFMGLTRDGADLACRRLQARGANCHMIGSDG